jgi:hypothetical protein
MADVNGYEGIVLRQTYYPEAVAVFGWWRWRWLFEADDGELRPVLLPPPLGDVDPFPAVVSSSWLEGGRLVVDCYSRDEVIPGDALAYVSTIAAWLQHRHEGEILVHGESDHPIFRMSHLDEGLIAELTEAGY